MSELPYSFSRQNHVVMYHEDDQPCIGLTAETTVEAVNETVRLAGLEAKLQMLSKPEFDRKLSQSYENRSMDNFSEVEKMGDDMDLDTVAKELAEPEDLLENDDDAPIIRLINALITESIKKNASDIHIEPFESRLSVRFRVDGVLQEVLQPPRQIASLLVSRIKVMAKLDIAEKRLPQDGRIALKMGNRPVDIRVSTLPSGHGERVVLRILDKQAGRLELNHLGMNERTRDLLAQLINKPHGIILVTGPTGSGKTTSLYAMLSQLNDSERNILTVEDPIEYDLDGIGQTPVNTKVDMTFAKGLRAILRQDPDVVMVGEIRDNETAQIAVQASLTGHLVLSTLHTNSAVGAITRLMDMGIEPFLLSSTLLGVLSQRLVRQICPTCKTPFEPSAKDVELYHLDDSKTLYQSVGCDDCLHMGFKGRQGIYELLSIDENLSRMIHDGTSQQDMQDYANKQSTSIRQDGLEKVYQGLTTLNEVVRVTKDN
ncbi:MAG: type II secretion system ATPase GspE [Gammaproteobacteria bacterium]|nr:type II secretion system ATPase GspE [Gammaproteobacteria bacterium]